MDRRSAAAIRRDLISIGLALGALAASPARTPQPFAIPLAPSAPLELGTAWSAARGGARAEPGTCVESPGSEQRPGGAPSFSLVTLSRAGGRLVLGIYVSAPFATETLREARLNDAARRMGGAQAAQFRALCGDGFIGAVVRGGSYIAELEVDPADAARAAAVVSPRLGTTSDPARFREALESVTSHFRSVARELPGGSHAAAKPVEPAALVRRALALPGSVNEASAQPYLAAFVPYPADATTGVPIEIQPATALENEAEQVFLWDRRGVDSKARAAELQKARSHAEVEPSGPQSTAPPLESDAGIARPASAAQVAPRESDAVVAPPASPPQVAEAPAGEAPAPPPIARQPVPQVPAPLHASAALVFETAAGVQVFATTQPPPGVYAEPVGHRQYWVPGAAEASASVRDAIRSVATSAAPARGTTILTAASGVVLTDAPPQAGIHSERAGDLYAWIAGVSQPTTAQQAALNDAVRAHAGP